KALKKRLADNSQPKRITYSSYNAHNSFNFIDIKFYPTELPKNAFKDITATTNNNSDQLFKNYESMLQDALSIVQEQHEIKNVKWAKSVEKSFEGINKLVMDIK
ncbi:6986_t:CDS:2, partial [Cetraspora pellucida]